MMKEAYLGYVPVQANVDGRLSDAHMNHLNFFNRACKVPGASYVISHYGKGKPNNKLPCFN